jgi:hypothetical protein
MAHCRYFGSEVVRSQKDDVTLIIIYVCITIVWSIQTPTIELLRICAPSFTPPSSRRFCVTNIGTWTAFVMSCRNVSPAAHLTQCLQSFAAIWSRRIRVQNTHWSQGRLKQLENKCQLPLITHHRACKCKHTLDIERDFMCIVTVCFTAIIHRCIFGVTMYLRVYKWRLEE